MKDVFGQPMPSVFCHHFETEDQNTMPVRSVEAASMSYDRRRALRRAAIYDAWVNAGHYSKDIQPLNDVALIEIALDAIEHVDTILPD